MSSYFVLIGFGPQGWGDQLLKAMLMTVIVSVAAFVASLVFGIIAAWAKLSASRVARAAGEAYTTILRGIPDLLVIYLFYFGGSNLVTAIGHALGGQGAIGFNGFTAGMLAVGIVAGAYQTEVLRGAYLAIPREELEAARAVGMSRPLMLRRITIPLALRTALPGMGNVWQSVVKESALISIVGLTELTRQVQISARSTDLPFQFYATGAALYLVITAVSGLAFRGAERPGLRGLQRP